MEKIIESIKVFIPIIAAFVTGGGLVAFVKFLSDRPGNLAKARQVNVTAEITIGEQWKIYAEKIEKRMDEQGKEFARQMREKDEEIKKLKDRVFDLEQELLIHPPHAS